MCARVCAEVIRHPSACNAFQWGLFHPNTINLSPTPPMVGLRKSCQVQRKVIKCEFVCLVLTEPHIVKVKNKRTNMGFAHKIAPLLEASYKEYLSKFYFSCSSP